LRDLIEAIAFLASKGIVHADVKPDNILCADVEQEQAQNQNRQYAVRLVDFGSSHLFQNPNAR
jgi:serine/threonine protein kinase